MINRKKGFTLIELIVVIAIIAILFSVVVPISIKAFKSTEALNKNLSVDTLKNDLVNAFSSYSVELTSTIEEEPSNKDTITIETNKQEKRRMNLLNNINKIYGNNFKILITGEDGDSLCENTANPPLNLTDSILAKINTTTDAYKSRDYAINHKDEYKEKVFVVFINDSSNTFTVTEYVNFKRNVTLPTPIEIPRKV